MQGEMSDLEEILLRVRSGSLEPQEAKRLLLSYEDLGYARVDIDRTRRKGFSEVVFAEGKTAAQVVGIIEELRNREKRVLATRVPASTAEAVVDRWPDFSHNLTARTLSWIREGESQRSYDGYVAIVSGGTSDMAVAEEAAVTVETLGAEARRVYDVGVAGIHRLLANIEEVRAATAAVVVAGMEGALGSVVTGLVACPVVAVPTSVGYGASFEGLAPLLTMLNSCAPGISVVNIDNGFGAGYFAALVCRQATRARKGGAWHGE